MDMFISKPLREEDLAVLRAQAAAYAEQRALEAETAAMAAQTGAQEAQAALEAAAMRATTAHAVLGLPVVAAAQRRASSQGSGSSLEAAKDD
jgi:hypothetical protein